MISVLALLAAPALAVLDHDGTPWSHVVNFDQSPASAETIDADGTKLDGWTYVVDQQGGQFGPAEEEVWSYGDGIGTMVGFFPGPGAANSWFTIPSFFSGNQALRDYTPEAGFTLEWRIKILTPGNDATQKIGIILNTVKPAAGTGGEPYGIQAHFTDQPDPGGTQPEQIVNRSAQRGSVFTTMAYVTPTKDDFHTYRLVFPAQPAPPAGQMFVVNSSIYKDGQLLGDDWGTSFTAGDLTGMAHFGYISGSPSPAAAQWDFVRMHPGDTPPPAGMPCDFNSDSDCNDLDIDLLAAAVRNGTSDAKFNVDGVGGDIPDDADFDFYITDDSMLSTGLGDHDLNMIVNFNDFVKLSNDFGMSGTGWDQGNGNTDDVTNFNDFVRVSNNYGMSFASGSNVPEPMALTLVAIGGLLVTRRSRA